MKKFLSALIINIFLVLAAQTTYLNASPFLSPDGDQVIKDTLSSAIVSSGMKRKSNSPLRLTTISKQQIDVISTARTFPEILKNVPGVFATSESGSYGDAKVNIRGFGQENISVLLNGIPISGLTSGSMYWNNWIGLTDATSSMQVQKGIGGSMFSDNSIGGTINIVTMSPDIAPGNKNVATNGKLLEHATFSNYWTADGSANIALNMKSGDLKGGWAYNLSASYVWGSGYVEATDRNSFAYLFSASKRLNKNNVLIFTALGSPEKHQLRASRMTYEEVEKYGRRYNKSWGYFDGKKKTLSKNFYFKPYFTLNHLYNKGKLSLNNAVYMAYGDGGGAWSETASSSWSDRASNQLKDGQVDWDKIVGEGKTVLTDYLAGHIQLGALSVANLKFNKTWNLEFGLHYQYYRTWQNEKITDLLGMSSWYEDYENTSFKGVAGRDVNKYVGDIIKMNNGMNKNYLTAYSMATLTKGRFIWELGASMSLASYQRRDSYNYSKEDELSDIAHGTGASIKSGILYKVSDGISAYANAGIYSRVPYSNVYFASGSNVISEGVNNEHNYLGEAGLRLLSDRGTIEATVYSAYWENKTLMSDTYRQSDEVLSRYMIPGLDAFHYGIELDASYRFTKRIYTKAYASIGSWHWKNNVSAIIYDEYTGVPVDNLDIYSDGLPVGDAPQTQIGADINWMIYRDNGLKHDNTVNIILSWNYYDRYWADFTPDSRTDVEDSANPFRIPAYNLFDLNITYSHSFSENVEAELFMNARNLFDESYMERGRDGATHDKESFTGYPGMGRNWNMGVRFKF